MITGPLRVGRLTKGLTLMAACGALAVMGCGDDDEDSAGGGGDAGGEAQALAFDLK